MSVRRIAKERKVLEDLKPENYTVQWSDTDLHHCTAWLKGPPGSPYEGGNFRLNITFPQNYPYWEPYVYSITPIYHPQFQENSRICCEMLWDWAPACRLSEVLDYFYELLTLAQLPKRGWAHNIRMLEQLRDDRSLFEQTAREWTQRYASNPPSSPSE
jgi:ubiquitin-protein ligase